VSRLVIHNAVLLDPEGAAPAAGALLIEGGRIRARLRAGDPIPEDALSHDAAGHRIAPGFLDVHYHGAFVFSRNDAYHDALEQAASSVRHGTTGYLATTVAWSAEELPARVETLAAALDATPEAGARPLGLHLEGPWISAEAAGAQPSQGVHSPRSGEIEEVLGRASGLVRMVTLAPEIPGAFDLQARLLQHDVVVALGHSRARVDEVVEAVDRGARHVTHLFNAMGPLHHRDPGLAGTALADPRLSADLICDGVHLHPQVVRFAARALGERLLLITDRVTLPRDPDAGASFGSGALRDDGVALRTPEGRLAGSCLTLDRAIKNANTFADMTLLEAVRAATLAPARLLGIEAEHGTLRSGARADLAVLDERGAVVETWLGGRRVHLA
jgi:N-acetylglucosamine-6-phosphate deacetylase